MVDWYALDLNLFDQKLNCSVQLIIDWQKEVWMITTLWDNTSLSWQFVYDEQFKPFWLVPLFFLLTNGWAVLSRKTVASWLQKFCFDTLVSWTRVPFHEMFSQSWKPVGQLEIQQTELDFRIQVGISKFLNQLRGELYYKNVCWRPRVTPLCFLWALRIIHFLLGLACPSA